MTKTGQLDLQHVRRMYTFVVEPWFLRGCEKTNFIRHDPTVVGRTARREGITILQNCEQYTGNCCWSSGGSEKSLSI